MSHKKGQNFHLKQKKIRSYFVELDVGSFYFQLNHLRWEYTYSKVPNNSAARLLIFKKFSLPTRLIWTYTLIKIQTIFLPTRLLSTKFYFFCLFLMLLAAFFHYNCSSNAFFHAFSSLYYFLGWKKFWNCF